MSLTKQRLSLVVAFDSVRSKFLTRILQRPIQAFDDRSITHLATAGTNPDLPCAAFSWVEGLVERSNLIFRMICGYTFSSSCVRCSG
ncbi:hypothetical protein [Nostoc sp.]|uniref:hypothetical protein n=1 Tax=Nostoc sp. TaxID=1180 RepID=UPI002FF96CEA